jgi:hypothetical protein
MKNRPVFGDALAAISKLRASRMVQMQTMNRTLAEHIEALEQQVKVIGALIMQENDAQERNHLESELRAVESALTQYRSAFVADSRLYTK